MKFPCPVKGARPVSEVAGAVVARGFAFPDSDAAVTPWTLDNPANNFAALSSTARLSLVDAGGRPVGDYAIAVAEIVVPDLASAAPLARELVRALARVGVTATTSTAEGARHGSLTVDSNLPDIRIVLGGPDFNAYAGTLLAAAQATQAGQLIRGLTQDGAVRLFLPGQVPIESAWVPGADLRGPRAIPALLVAGSDRGRLDAEVEAMVAELGQARLTACCVDPDPGALLEDYTVGLLTYGIPGFAVDTQGALHLSLLRSCTGWPSGVWMDPPVRRAPDGSAFQLQHWTHDFDYSLVAGPGDWRDQDLVSRGLEHSTPLHGRVAEAHSGSLPPTHALLTVEPARQVQVQAIKMAGNPCATGQSVPSPHRRGMTVRLTESQGHATVAEVRTAVELSAAHRSDLVEDRLRDSAYVDGRIVTALDGAEIATVIATPQGSGRVPAPGPGASSRPALGPTREVAQPIYARYWLHNRGPAPMGFLPVAVSAAPTAVRLTGREAAVAVSVASQLTDSDVAAVLAVDVPRGWSAEPAQRPLRLAAAAHTTFPLRVTAPPDAPSGLYFVRLRLPVAQDEVVEEVLTVIVPGSPLDAVLPTREGPEVAHEVQMHGTQLTAGRSTGLEIECLTPGVETALGCDAFVDFRLTNRAMSDIDGELMVVSPWGAWDLAPDAVRAFAVGAGDRCDLRIPVHAPATASPGTWWLMVKLMWFGRVHYSPTVPIVIRPAR